MVINKSVNFNLFNSSHSFLFLPIQKSRLKEQTAEEGKQIPDISFERSLRWHYPDQINGQQWINLLSQPDSLKHPYGQLCKQS